MVLPHQDVRSFLSPLFPRSKRWIVMGVEADYTEFIKFDFFVDGTPEDWIKWLMGYMDIETSKHLNEPLEEINTC
jgi:hypothetical protein